MALPERLKFGIFMAPFHRINENPTLALERDLELVQWLETLGFDEVWVVSTIVQDGKLSPVRKFSSVSPGTAPVTSSWVRGWSACPITIPSWSRTGWCCWITSPGGG